MSPQARRQPPGEERFQDLRVSGEEERGGGLGMGMQAWGGWNLTTRALNAAKAILARGRRNEVRSKHPL